MVYQLNTGNYKDFDKYRENVLEPRGYFIPFASAEELRSTDIRTERFGSSRVAVLSGKWSFQYYGSVNELPGSFDPDNEEMDKITVPSTWQHTGYEKPCYINTRYQFPVNPPHIKEDCPVGVYSKKFKLDDIQGNYTLTFLGAAACIDVFMNGKYVGYSEGAHNTAEFDIKPFMEAGVNEIVVAVYKFCNGSYLEAQDMFRDNGIFRDVLLTKTEEDSVYDFTAETQKNENGTYNLKITPSFKLTNRCNFKVRLTDKEGEEIASVEQAVEPDNVCAITFPALKVEEWSAELPNLYNLTLELESFVEKLIVEQVPAPELDVPEATPDAPSAQAEETGAEQEAEAPSASEEAAADPQAEEQSAALEQPEEPEMVQEVKTILVPGKTIEIIRKHIGFKTVAVSGNVFLFNGQKIKILGVNHHDTDPEEGFVLSVQKMERDVTVMKAFNCNAVRTSHYPPDPTFLDLCDEYGLYVIDEADIETHGCSNKMNLISNNPVWKEHYWDRVYRMYQRDKNHPAITMWSLGNESGGICNQDYCYNNLKKLTPIPIHYEGACRSKRKYYDVYSQMYWPSTALAKFMKWKYPKAYGKVPYFLCEYCHAMGVGAGALEDYMQLFYQYDCMMGGCIWEFADHAAYHEEGPYRYTYGGDHGERIHDGNFCVDGLFFPDRTPHSGAYNMRCAYRPVRASYVEGNTFTFASKLYFASTAGITLNWELRVNGVKYEDGILPLEIAPQDSQNIKLPYQPINTANDNTIVFTYFNVKGKEIAREQIELSTAQGAAVTDTYKGEVKMALSPCEQKVDILFDGGSILLNKATGFIESYVVDGIELVNQVPLRFHKGFGFELYRAPFDNDMNMRRNWEKMGLDKLAYKVKKCNITHTDETVVIDLRFEGNTPVRYMWADFTAAFELKYTVYRDGRLGVDAAMPYVKGIRNLPRFGLVLELPKQFDKVRYFGLGEEQSLSDFREHVVLGVYNTNVAQMHEPYIKPQESGMRSDCRWAEVTDDEGAGLRFDFVDRHFTFNANHYTVQQLARCTHAEDVREYDTTNVHIDGFMMGAGSNSCGQRPVKGHKLPNRNLKFSLVVTPLLPSAEKDN